MKTMNDPIIAEIRRIRDEYARRFNYDLHAMCEDLRRKQELRGARVVTYPPRRPRTFPMERTKETAIPTR
jgi:hypothetical protein